MLTKEDLKSIASIVKTTVKDEIEPFRSEVKGEFRFVHGEIARLDKKIDGVESRLGWKIDDLRTSVDGLAQNHKGFELELAAERSARDRLEERLNDKR